ncbi:MAG: 3-dehydroquinate synthase [Phenylobacterium sp.]|jgi:3-dehydroquinate synthase
MAQLNVDLGARSYPIFINTASKPANAPLAPFLIHSNVVIISNATVAKLYLDSLKQTLQSLPDAPIDNYNVSTFLMPDGEAYKTLDTFNDVISFMLEKGFGRDTTLIALGGGVVGDLTGFVAACYQRGIDFIQIPTTLLAQVDSSVGGKTAINHPLGKNMVGAFYQPQAVVIDVNSLTSLPAREFSAGMAEVIKYGVANNVELFAYLQTHKDEIKALDSECLGVVIHRCCAIKAEIVRLDEKEAGVRALLNFGHTFGHAIEAQMGYGNWLHGEAVAAGMVHACKIAELQGLMTAAQVKSVVELLVYFDLPVSGPEDMVYDDYLEHMRKDKKTLAGEIRFVLPTGIGASKVTAAVSVAHLQQVLGTGDKDESATS